MIRIISRAVWHGLDDKRRQRGGTAAVIDCDGVRFFSLSARDEEDAVRINNAAERAETVLADKNP